MILGDVAGVGTAGSTATQITGQISGVTATSSVGTASAAYSNAQIIVSLYSDNDGVPGTFIAIIGNFDAADVGSSPTTIELAPSSPISLTPNTRYWVQVTNTLTTTVNWVTLADDGGTGVSTEFWYTSSGDSGSNTDGTAYQMAVFVVETIGISGVDAAGSAGLVSTNPSDNAQIIVSLYSDNAGVPGTFIEIIGSFDAREVGFSPTTIALAPASPISLTPNTRYWIQVTNTLTTTVNWVTLSNDGGTGVSTEFWYTSSGASGANTDGTAYQMAVFVVETVGVMGVTTEGQAGSPAAQVAAGEISGVTGLSDVATILGEQALGGVAGIGAVGTVSTAHTGNEFVPMGGVAATGLAGTVEPTHRKAYKTRSGRGSPWRHDPNQAPVSRPDTETLADKMARWRKTVSDALELPEKPPEEVEESVPIAPDFSFLSLLDEITKPRADAEPIADIVQKSRMRMLAEAEDDILLGIAEDDDFELGLLTL